MLLWEVPAVLLLMVALLERQLLLPLLLLECQLLLLLLLFETTAVAFCFPLPLALRLSL
jgi:hypothetical protein